MEFLLKNELPDAGTVSITKKSTPAASGEQGQAAASGEIQASALNGAQIASLLELMIKTSTGEISKDSAKSAAKLSFPLASDAAIASVFDPIVIKPIQPASA
jgi:hypothetical protein